MNSYNLSLNSTLNENHFLYFVIKSNLFLIIGYIYFPVITQYFSFYTEFVLNCKETSTKWKIDIISEKETVCTYSYNLSFISHYILNFTLNIH